MENKKSLGEFIQQKRKEAGLTQKELATKLYISESAISKWERGLSYPDITLIKDICGTLHISERELLTASEDTQTRTNEKLAEKYLKLIQRFKLIQIVLYSLTLLACFICNLAIHHTLSWFFVVLTAVMTSASLTLLPTLVIKRRGFIILASFTLSLLLLLFTCNIYVGGNWFILVSVAVIFGLCITFLPFMLRNIFLPAALANHKALICMAVDTILLFFLLVVCEWFAKGSWFANIALPITAFWLVPPWGMLLIIRYTPLSTFFKAAACLGLSSLAYYLSTGFMPLIINGTPLHFGYTFDFSTWTINTVSNNVNMLVFFVLLIVTVAFSLAGIISFLRKTKSNASSQDVC